MEGEIVDEEGSLTRVPLVSVAFETCWCVADVESLLACCRGALVGWVGVEIVAAEAVCDVGCDDTVEFACVATVFGVLTGAAAGWPEALEFVAVPLDGDCSEDGIDPDEEREFDRVDEELFVPDWVVLAEPVSVVESDSFAVSVESEVSAVLVSFEDGSSLDPVAG